MSKTDMQTYVNGKLASWYASYPNYVKTTVTCACGETFEAESTKENIQVEVCSKCHPFYTGKQNLGTKKGQVEKFNKKFGFTTEK